MDTSLTEGEIGEKFPSLLAYLEEGKERNLHERYLCRHRVPWYVQEQRPAPPIICTYIGRSDTKRGRPFRFILNHSRATVANAYLAMYPIGRLATALESDPALLREVWNVLNALTPDQLLREGRVYGGGLHKLEPRELANVEATLINAMLSHFEGRSPVKQLTFKETFTDFSLDQLV